MKPDPATRWGRWVLASAGHLFRWLLLLVGATLRTRIVEGEEHLRSLHENPRPVVISHWHDRAFLGAHFLYRRLHQQGITLTLLASQSRDGETVSRMVRAWGIETVRGSATRGGTLALRALHRAVVRRQSSPILIPDGPKGPQYVFKKGVAVLAQTTGAPVLPLGFAADRPWHLGSWDRLIVPRPFSRVTIAIGEPMAVDASLDSEALEARRRELEAEVDRVTEAAEAALGNRFRGADPSTRDDPGDGPTRSS